MKHGHRRPKSQATRRGQWYVVQHHDGWLVYDRSQKMTVTEPTKRPMAQRRVRKLAAQAWHEGVSA